LSGFESDDTAELPEITVDFNARYTRHGYALLPFAIQELARLGLTPQQAVGRRFLFNGGDDGDQEGYLAEILCRGTIVDDSKWGYLAECDDNGYFWRRKGPRLFDVSPPADGR